MFNQERHTEILRLLEKNQRVSVTELSGKFQVSVDTVRRDLRQMEQEGLLNRAHGGAILPQKSGVSFGYSTRKKLHQREKTGIARIAATFISDDDTLLLDGSTTAAAIIPELSSFKGLTVFTNSIAIAAEINATHPQIKLFMIGGLLHSQHASTISIECLTFIRKLYVDKVFVGSCSISPERGLSASIIDDAAIKRAMLHAGRQVIILADSTKFMHESLIQIAPLDPGFIVITDNGFDESLRSQFRTLQDQGLKIIIAE